MNDSGDLGSSDQTSSNRHGGLKIMVHPVKQGTGSDDNALEQEQRSYWQQLRAELQRYKDEFNATNLELSKGLDISRQPLVDFMQATRQDLPVGRIHLKRLWHHLTNPDDYDERKLSSEGKLSRIELKKEGANRLLRAAGFLPDTEDESSIHIDPNRGQQIQRIISGLSNIPIGDFDDFIDIVNFLEKELVSRAFSLKNSSSSESKNIVPYFEMSESEIDEWIHSWIKKNIYVKPDRDVLRKFKKVIYKLVRFGRYQLEDSEIFELYLSIHENNRLNRRNELDKFESSYKLKIAQCQFSTLTFSLSDFHYGSNKAIAHDLEKVGLKVESTLRISADNSAYPKALTSKVVIEALVSCTLTGVGKRADDEESIYWRYSSSATHFENMLSAIYQGMGCENELELTNFSLYSLGKKSDSLIKSSITFSGSDNAKYQGIWVDESSIFGTAKAISVAVKEWLAKNLSNPEEYLGYYHLCKELADINDSLNHGRKTVSDYAMRRSEYPETISVDESIRKDVIEKVESLESSLLIDIPILQQLYGLDLKKKKCLANLVCARSSHIEGDLLTARKFLIDANSVLQDPAIGADITLQLFMSSEKMLNLLYSGNDIFIKNKDWRKRFRDDLKKLQDYIYLSQESFSFKKHCGRLDLNIYRSASEIFARVGRLDFCLSDIDDIEHLEAAFSRLLMAAYCSAKVGDRQRVAHWIANASRVCCRLGLGGKALALSKLAEEIIHGSTDYRYSSLYKRAIMAEVYITQAEIYLLIENDYNAALVCFLNSLKGAAYLGFSRLMADGLYGVYRASKEIHNQAFAASLDEIFSDSVNSSAEDRWPLQKELKGKRARKLVIDVVQFINGLEGNDVWSSVSEQFKEQAKHIWHYWAVTASKSKNARHPVEELIDQNRFLCRLQ
ncbi:MAG: hypothetical protein AAF959_09595 [Cyanobacteria bacterium P01_D01_bin.56]